MSNLDLYGCEQQLRRILVSSGLKPSELYYILMNLTLEMKDLYSQAVLLEQKELQSKESNNDVGQE